MKGFIMVVLLFDLALWLGVIGRAVAAGGSPEIFGVAAAVFIAAHSAALTLAVKSGDWE